MIYITAVPSANILEVSALNISLLNYSPLRKLKIFLEIKLFSYYKEISSEGCFGKKKKIFGLHVKVLVAVSLLPCCGKRPGAASCWTD